MESVLECVMNDRRVWIQEICSQVEMSYTSVQRILKKDLKLRKKSAKFVPRILTDVHKQKRITCCRNALTWKRMEKDLFDEVITGDESYIYLYTPETKEQSKQWLDKDDPRPQKALQGRGTRHSKCMLVAFFNSRGLVHREFVRNSTITAAVYVNILDRLLVSIQHTRTSLWQSGRFVIHHDNAPAHIALVTKAWFARRHIRQLEDPPYSPDLAPADFWLFPRLKKVLRGIRFPDLNTLEFETDRLIGEITQAEFKQAVSVTWSHRMRKCIRFQGAYFEGIRG